MSSIRARDVHVVRGDVEVLHGVDLVAEPGDWLGLIGPNGAGKTTLIQALAGLLPARGEIRVAGLASGRGPGRELARSVALVPQRPEAPPGLTVLDYVLLGRTPYIPYLGIESRQDLEITHDILDRLDLTGFVGRSIAELSGGEFQRTVLARALAQQAPVLLLDEPTSALDVGHEQEVLELVDALRVADGLTVVAAMHDLTVAGQFADRLILLADGRVVGAGTPEEVLTERNLAAHYGARVRILRDDDGGIVVVPTRPSAGRHVDVALSATSTPTDAPRRR